MLAPSSLILVAAAAAYLVLLGVIALAAPANASRFLLGFAASARRHYVELGVRLLLGIAFVFAAPASRWPDAFVVAGGMLLATSTVMLFVPWRWHRAFAERSVPAALRQLPLIGVLSLGLGVGLIVALLPR